MDLDAALRTADDFFSDYARDLLARDAHAIAARYAVPGLILFPGQSLAVASQEQTADFFTGAFVQYEGIHYLGGQYQCGGRDRPQHLGRCHLDARHGRHRAPGLPARRYRRRSGASPF